MEAQLAQWVKDNNSRLPIVAFMAGKFMDDEEMQGMSFGHAGTIVEGKEDSATEKIARLEAAGIPVVQRIDEIPDLVKAKIAERSAAMRKDGTLHRRRGRRPGRRRRRAGPQADRGLPRRHLRARTPPARSRSWRSNLDECVLCRLCLDATPAGAVKIIKLYDDGAVLEPTPTRPARGRLSLTTGVACR